MHLTSATVEVRVMMAHCHSNIKMLQRDAPHFGHGGRITLAAEVQVYPN